VAEAVVVGLDDSEWGERVGALVVSEGDLDAEAVQNYCRERLAGLELPRTVGFVESLPRRASGTVKRDRVRELLRERGQ